MQILKPKSGKKEKKQYINQSPFEAISSIGTAIKDSAVEDLGRSSVYDAWEQLVRPGEKHEHKKGGELSVGQELDLTYVAEKAVELTQMGHDFAREVLDTGKKSASESSREVQVKIQEILIQIKQLKNSSEELREQVDIVAIEQTAEAPGKYQLGFIEQILSWIEEARANVEDGLAWFKALRSKKAARQYGVLAKKGGTSFTLSNERVVSTQTG